MNESLLDVPRLAALNTHFGMLPRYRGMSPVVWALSEGEQSIGLTVHKMVLEFDEGQIIRQEVLESRRSESVLGLTLRGADRASDMLVAAVLDVAADPYCGARQTGPGSYHSLPTKQAISQLYARGRKLWRWPDMLDLWRRS